MKYGMATLYSRFAAGRAADESTICSVRPEGSRRIKRVFCDVPRQFLAGGVVKRRQWRLTAGLLVAASLAGCAAGTGVGGLGPSSTPEVKREAVAARAKARWEALIKLDLDGAYAFLSPASKATTPLDLYKAKHKIGMYRAVKVDDVNCEADRCTVNLSVTYDYKRFKGVTTPLVEKWIIANGQAWFVEQG
jgi:hypothetical protein